MKEELEFMAQKYNRIERDINKLIKIKDKFVIYENKDTYIKRSIILNHTDAVLFYNLKNLITELINKKKKIFDLDKLKRTILNDPSILD